MLYTVEKIEGGFAVMDWVGEIEIAYRSRKHADQYALGATHELFTAAEVYDERRECVMAYLAERAERPAPAPSAQLEMF